MREMKKDEIEYALSSLRSDGEFTDITMKSNGKTFSLHRSILAIRCPQLLKEEEVEEEKNGDIGVEVEVFEALIDFLYSNSYNQRELIETNRLVSLLKISERYSVKLLQMMCERTIIQMISSENVIDLLKLSDELKLKREMEWCVWFVSTTMMKENYQ